MQIAKYEKHPLLQFGLVLSNNNLQSTFRQQAIDYANEISGVTRIDYLNKSQRVIAVLICFFVTCLTLMSVYIEIPIRVLASGTVSASSGVDFLAPKYFGVLSEIYVTQGQSVEPGEPIARITFERQSKDGKSVDSQIISNFQSRIGTLRESLKLEENRWQGTVALRKNQEKLQQQIRASNNNVFEGTKSLHEQLVIEHETLSSLTKTGAVSKLELDSARLRIIDAEIKVAQARSQQLFLEQEGTNASVRHNSDKLVHESAKEAIESQLGSLTKMLLETRVSYEHVISSAIRGSLASINVSPGDIVKQGEVFGVVLADDYSLQIELVVLNDGAAKVEIGDKLFLEYEMFPSSRYGTFEGKVVSIALSAFPLSDGNLQTENGVRLIAEPLERCMPQTKNKLCPLLGSGVRAYIEVDRLSVFQFLLSPIRRLATMSET